MIRITDGRKTYHRGQTSLDVLKGISVHIPEHDYVAIMGPSGSGKSTLLNVLGCLDVLDQGQYELAGQRIDNVSLGQLARIRNRRFGFVFQLFNLIPRLSAQRNVELPMMYAGIAPAERARRAREALASVGLQARCDHSPAELSGGQQQRVAIARAIVNEPDIIIADEPTGSLDSTSGQDVMALFRDMHEQGKTIIMVTHELEIAAHAERVLRLRDGVMVEDSRS
ncbi:ABC transporter ATP-binding protein [Burkholderia sp. FERM BP-3421]|jgi:putative ABC transport system ATP-binding protein|uniref:ABC transporter ATP-binding protein n=1 Tax=Burkholderia sp. FERM BP-3421 TaxID=1494466 RepID=UPI00235F70B5|nr:ABC transporter ATP-binding protein [Burkholderia sp. FERM BP-3421]WDD92421.1 ABC transporter ATP-binding protein [Burkholderia sp. FERM BP-3421]